MERKFKILFALVAGTLLLAPMLIYNAAQAAVAISGTTKKTDGSILTSARVSAEAYGFHYHNTISNGVGQWTLNVDNGISYTVDASKFPYTRDRETGVIGPRSCIIHNQAVQGPSTIEFFIVADEEFRLLYGSAWKTTAKDKLYGAETYFGQQHNIQFKDKYYYLTWDSNDSAGTCALKDEAKTETGWSSGNHQGANVMWVISADDVSGQPGGCSDTPQSMNLFPASIVIDFASLATTVMHEVSHCYGLVDGTQSDGFWDIMSKNGHTNNNWKPTNDDLMQLRRGWY